MFSVDSEDNYDYSISVYTQIFYHIEPLKVRDKLLHWWTEGNYNYSESGLVRL